MGEVSLSKGWERDALRSTVAGRHIFTVLLLRLERQTSLSTCNLAKGNNRWLGWVEEQDIVVIRGEL